MKRVLVVGLIVLALFAGCRPRVRFRSSSSSKDVTASKSAGKSRSRIASEEASSGRTSTWTAGSNADDLGVARRAFVSQLTVRGPAPQEYDNLPLAGVQQVEYESAGLRLKGWLSADSGDGKKHPAVVFLHGGWAFGGEDWMQGEPFVKAGFVLFMPALRGENGNPGHYEAFLGEVDDAVAAGTFVASQPNVDVNNVFVVGHSVGAILSCLTTMVSSPYKAAAAYDGHVDMKTFAANLPNEYFPFDKRIIEEISIRNPMDFAPSIRRPLKLYATRDGSEVNAQFAATAVRAGKDVKVHNVAGDHQTMVATSIRRSIEWFQQLAGK